VIFRVCHMISSLDNVNSLLLINVNFLHRDLGGILLHFLVSILASVMLIVLFRPLIALVKFFDQTNYINLDYRDRNNILHLHHTMGRQL
jgi:hypothetical protein